MLVVLNNNAVPYYDVRAGEIIHAYNIRRFPPFPPLCVLFSFDTNQTYTLLAIFLYPRSIFVHGSIFARRPRTELNILLTMLHRVLRGITSGVIIWAESSGLSVAAFGHPKFKY